MICAATLSARLQRVVQSITHFFLLQELRLFFFYWGFWNQYTDFIETFSVQGRIFIDIFLYWRMHVAITCLMLNLKPLGFKHILFFFSRLFYCFSQHRRSVILIIIFGYRHWFPLIPLILNLTHECDSDLTPIIRSVLP